MKEKNNPTVEDKPMVTLHNDNGTFQYRPDMSGNFYWVCLKGTIPGRSGNADNISVPALYAASLTKEAAKRGLRLPSNDKKTLRTSEKTTRKPRGKKKNWIKLF